MSPQNCSFPWREFDLHLIYMAPWAQPTHHPKRQLDRLRRFTEYTNVTDRQRDRPTDRPTDRRPRLLDLLQDPLPLYSWRCDATNNSKVTIKASRVTKTFLRGSVDPTYNGTWLAVIESVEWRWSSASDPPSGSDNPVKRQFLCGHQDDLFRQRNVAVRVVSMYSRSVTPR